MYSICNQMCIRYIDTNNYTVHFVTLRSFFSIPYYRASLKLLSSTNIVFIGSNSKVMLFRIDYLSIFYTILKFILDIDILQILYF